MRITSEDHRRCTYCTAQIERLYEGEEIWVDEGTADHHGGLVFCTDQDETHDGVRHAAFWTHGQLDVIPGESEDDYIERFSEFSNANEGREIRGLE